jgi:hypothetical protein
MSEQDKKRWQSLIEAARAGGPDAPDCASMPLDLLLKVDLELCALSALCGLRQVGALPPIG